MARIRYPDLVISMTTSPDTSVRITRAPARSSIVTVDAAGCPKSLPAPTLITALHGDHAPQPCSLRPFELP